MIVFGFHSRMAMRPPNGRLSMMEVYFGRAGKETKQ